MKTIRIIVASALLVIVPMVVGAWYCGPTGIPVCPYQPGPPCRPHYWGDNGSMNCVPYYHKRGGYHHRPSGKYSGLVIRPPYEGFKEEVVTPPPGNYSGIIIGNGRR